MRATFSTRLANAMPLIFLILGIGFAACAIIFSNANTETLITHQSIPATASTVPIDETTNGAFYDAGVYGTSFMAAACFICAAITAIRRTPAEASYIATR